MVTQAYEKVHATEGPSAFATSALMLSIDLSAVQTAEPSREGASRQGASQTRLQGRFPRAPPETQCGERIVRAGLS